MALTTLSAFIQDIKTSILDKVSLSSILKGDVHRGLRNLADSVALEYDSTIAYTVGQKIYFSDFLQYKCIIQTVAGENPTTTPLSWQVISGGEGLFAADIPVVLDPGETFGWYKNGDTIAAIGKNARQVIIQANTKYLAPSFSSFAISGQAQQIEVGSEIPAGSKTFAWATLNSARVAANTIIIRNVTGSPVDYITASPNDGGEFYTLLAAIAFSTTRIETFRILCTDTHGGTEQRDFDVESFYKVFYQGNLSSIPTDSAGVRGMSGSTFSKSFSITIPIGQTKLAFSYPAAWDDIVDSSVKYVEGFNSNVGATFIKTTFNVNTNAPGSVATSYKTFSVILPAPFLAVATYNVTIP